MPDVPTPKTIVGKVDTLEEKMRGVMRKVHKIADVPQQRFSIFSARSDRTAGNLTINSLTWTNVDTGTDLLLPAKALDSIEVAIAAVWGAELVVGQLDVVSVTGGNPVISWARNASPDNAHGGVPSWLGSSAVAMGVGGIVSRPVTSAEIVDGLVRLRLRAKTDLAVNKTLSSNANVPIIFMAKNLGQP